MGITALLTLAFWATLLPLAFSLPTHPSVKTTHLVKRAGPSISNSWTDPVQVGQIQRGIRDACDLAHAGFYELTNNRGYPSTIYNKYFPNGDNGFDLANAGAVLGNIVQATFDGTTNTDCADGLSEITISPDFPNPKNDNKMSCTDPSFMASLRNGRGPNHPILIVCPNALKQGNIGPDQLKVGGVDAPSPVTCAFVAQNGLRTTYRMTTLGSIILHEYTHFASLVQSQPFGTQDFLTHAEVPAIASGKREFFYGPEAVQRPYIYQQYGTWMADSYAWMATEALFTSKCGTSYAPSIQKDANDPAYGGVPGTENYAQDTYDDNSWPT